MMSAKLCVAADASLQRSCGETSGPSHVNFFGIVWPLEKTVFEIWKDIARPLPRCETKKGAEEPDSSECQALNS